jgi:hypothetical protein
MGNRRPERDARWVCLPSDRLELFARNYALIARCRRCQHWSELPVAVLLKEFGAEAAMERVMARLRCVQCGRLGARIEPKYRGPTHSDWR